jgi:Acyltransferase family
MRSVDELAAATPKTRDRYMDFLRAASIAAVVFGHWFIGVIHLESGLVYLTSAVGLSSGLWLGTWLFQVMPIFFFVGGFSNLTAYESFRRRGDTTGTFVRSRLERLLRPYEGDGDRVHPCGRLDRRRPRAAALLLRRRPRRRRCAGLRFEDLVPGVSIVGAAPPFADAHDYLTGTKSAAPTLASHQSGIAVPPARGVPQEPPDLLLVLIDASDVVLARVPQWAIRRDRYRRRRRAHDPLTRRKPDKASYRCGPLAVVR